MDIISGLTAVSTALKITKELRELDVSLSQAEMKAKFAELYSSLADAKMSLADANIQLQENQLAYKKLAEELDILKNGDFCPKCHTGRLELKSDTMSRGPGGTSGGIRDRQYQCANSSCGFVDSRVHDPHGLLKGMASR